MVGGGGHYLVVTSYYMCTSDGFRFVRYIEDRVFIFNAFFNVWACKSVTEGFANKHASADYWTNFK